LALRNENESSQQNGRHLGNAEIKNRASSYPDKSASIIIEVDSLESGIECLLTGPGIQTSSSANIKGLSDELLMALISGRGTFPQGVDLYLSSGHQIMAIPRTTRIQLSTEEALCTLQ